MRFRDLIAVMTLSSDGSRILDGIFGFKYYGPLVTAIGCALTIATVYIVSAIWDRATRTLHPDTPEER